MGTRLALAALLASTLTACGGPADDGRVDVSVIGQGFSRPDPDRAPMGEPDRVLASATAQGLVAFDGNGQVEPALAESWITTPDGLSTIFRIRAVDWPGGEQVSGGDVAASLDRSFADASRNPYRPLFTAVDEVVGMTGRVVEVRLNAPRPYLLQLLAQPELGIRRNGRGVGPYRIARFSGSRIELVPDRSDEELPAGYEPVLLRAERAPLAIARFKGGEGELVSGGTFADWPYVRAAQPRPGRLRFDPVQGLFGLAASGRSKLLASPNMRAALAMAIDRPALARAFGLDNWVTSERVLPAQLDSALAPAAPDWAGNTAAERRAIAAQQVRRTPGQVTVRVDLPRGPGMRLLFARLEADWRAIGVRTIRTAPGDPAADLRLIDAVAPNASANWYLTTLSCAAGLACDSFDDNALAASRAAPTLALRSARIADADARLAERQSFIPLGTPLRWSLVDPALVGWKENVFGAHALHRLRPLRVVTD